MDNSTVVTRGKEDGGIVKGKGSQRYGDKTIGLWVMDTMHIQMMYHRIVYLKLV